MNSGSEAAQSSHDPMVNKISAASCGRYRLYRRGNKDFIVSRSCPNITLILDRGTVYSRRRIRSMPPGCIFLDGAAEGPPRYDNKRRHYSLDHHVGCVRSFTLSTCEQAAIVLYQGIPLSDGVWSLFVNDIDLDSILSAWILMNHAELLTDGRHLLLEAMPLVRVEGAIDAHGLDAATLTGLPPQMLEAVEKNVADLNSLLMNAIAASDQEVGEIVLSALSALDGIVIPNDSMAELQARSFSSLCVSQPTRSGGFKIPRKRRKQMGRFFQYRRFAAEVGIPAVAGSGA